MLAQLVNQARPLGPEAKVLVLGGGYSGSCFARLLRALGTPVISTRRCPEPGSCLLYTSDAADDMQCVDLGGRRII